MKRSKNLNVFCVVIISWLIVLLNWGVPTVLATPIPGGTLDPNSIPKYQMPLIIPPAMPRTGEIKSSDGKDIDYYEIAVRQFQQQILPTDMPKKWGQSLEIQPPCLRIYHATCVWITLFE